MVKMKFILPLYSILIITIRTVYTNEVDDQSVYSSASYLQDESSTIPNNAEFQNGVSAFSRDVWTQDVYDATSKKFKRNFLKGNSYKDWLKYTVNKATVNEAELENISYEDWLVDFLKNAPMDMVKNNFSRTDWIKEVISKTFVKYGKYFKQSEFPSQDWLREVLDATDATYNKDFKQKGYTYEGWLKDTLKNTPIFPGQTYEQFLRSLYEHTSSKYKSYMKKFNFDAWLADILHKTSAKYSRYFKILPFSKETWISEVLQKTSSTYNKFFDIQLGYSYEKWLRAASVKARIYPGQSYEEWLSEFYEYSPLNYKVNLRLSNFPYNNWIQDILSKTSYDIYFTNDTEFVPEHWVTYTISKTPQYSTIFLGDMGYSYEDWLKQTLSHMSSTTEYVTKAYYKEWLKEIIEKTPLNYKIYLDFTKFSFDDWLEDVQAETSTKYFKYFKNRLGLPVDAWKTYILKETALEYEIYFENSEFTYKGWLTESLSKISSVKAYKKYEDWLRDIIKNTSELYLTYFKNVNFSMELWLRNIYILSSSEYMGYFKRGAGLAKADWIVNTYKMSSDKYNKYFPEKSNFTFIGYLVDGVDNAPDISYELKYNEWLQAVGISSSSQYQHYLSSVNFPVKGFIYDIYSSTNIEYSLYFKLITFEYPKEWITYVLSLTEITSKYKKYFSVNNTYENWLRDITSKTKLNVEINYYEWLFDLVDNTSPECKKCLASKDFPVVDWINDIYIKSVPKFGQYFKPGKTDFKRKWLNLVTAEFTRKYNIFFQEISKFTYTDWLADALPRSTPNFKKTYDDWLRSIIDSTGITFKQYLIESNFPISSWLEDVYNQTANTYVWLFKAGKKTTAEHWLQDIFASTSYKYEVYFKSAIFSYQKGLTGCVARTEAVSNNITYDDWLREIIASTTAEYKEFMSEVSFPLNSWILDVLELTSPKFGWYFKAGSKATSEYWLQDVLKTTSSVYGIYFRAEYGFSYKTWLMDSLMHSTRISTKLNYDQWLRELVDATSVRFKHFLIQQNFPVNKWLQDVHMHTVTTYGWYFKSGSQSFTESWLKDVISLTDNTYKIYFLDDAFLSYTNWLETISDNSQPVFMTETYDDRLRDILDSTPLNYRNYLIKSKFPVNNWLKHIYRLTWDKYGWYFKYGFKDTATHWLKYTVSISSEEYRVYFEKDSNFTYEDWLSTAVIKSKPISKEITYTDWLTSIADGTSFIYKQYLILNKFPTANWLYNIFNETKIKFGWFFKAERNLKGQLLDEILSLTSSTYQVYFKGNTSYADWLEEIFAKGPEISNKLTYREWLESIINETPPDIKTHITNNGMSLDVWLNDVYYKTLSKFEVYFKNEISPFAEEMYSYILGLLVPKYEKYFEGANFTLEDALKQWFKDVEPSFVNQTYMEWLQSVPKSYSPEFTEFMEASNLPIDEMIQLVYTETLSMYEKFFKPPLSNFNGEYFHDAFVAINSTCGPYFEKESGLSLEAGLRQALSKSTPDFNRQTYKDYIYFTHIYASPIYVEYLKKINYPTENCLNLIYSKTVSKFAHYFPKELEEFKQKWFKLIMDISPDKFIKFFKEGSGLSYEAGIQIALKTVKLMFEEETYKEWLVSLTQNAAREYKESGFPFKEWIDFIFNETFTYFDLFKRDLSIFSHNWIIDVLKLTTAKCGVQFVNGSGFSYAGSMLGAIKYAEPQFNKQTYKEWILVLVEKIPLPYKQYMEEVNYPLNECIEYIYETTKDKYVTYFKQRSDMFKEIWFSSVVAVSSKEFDKYFESIGTLSYRDVLRKMADKTIPLFTEQTYKEFLKNLVENIPSNYVKYAKDINFDLNIWISYVYRETITQFGSYFVDDMSIFTKTFLIDALILTSTKAEPYFPKGSGFSYEAMLRHILKYSEPMFNIETYEDWLNRAIDRYPEYIDFPINQDFPAEEIGSIIYMETKPKYTPYFKQKSPNFIEKWIGDVYFLTDNKFSQLFNNTNLSYIDVLHIAILNPPKFSEQTYKDWLKSLTQLFPPEYNEVLKNIKFNKEIWINYVYQETIYQYSSYFKEELSIFSQSWVRDTMLVSSETCGRYFQRGSGFSFNGALRSAVITDEPAFSNQTYRYWIQTAKDNRPQKHKNYMEAVGLPLNECAEFIYDETARKYNPLFKQIPNDDFISNWYKYILQISSSKYSPIFPAGNPLGLSYEGALIDVLSKASPVLFEDQMYSEWLYSLVNKLSPIYKLYLKDIEFDMDNYISFIYNESVEKYATYFKIGLSIFSESFIKDSLILGKYTCGTYFEKGTGVSFAGLVITSVKSSPPMYEIETYKSWIQATSHRYSEKVHMYLKSIHFPQHSCVNYIYLETLPKYGPLFKQESKNFDKLWLNKVLEISSHIYEPLFSKGLSYRDGLKKGLENSKPISFNQTYKEWLIHIANSATPEYVEYLKKINFNMNNWINFVYTNTLSKFGTYFKSNLSPFKRHYARDLWLVSDSKCGSYFKTNNKFSLESATESTLGKIEPNFKKETFTEFFSRVLSKISPDLSSYLDKIHYPFNECADFIFNKMYATYEPYFKPELSEFSKHWLKDILSFSSLKYSKYYQDDSGLSYEVGIPDSLSRSTPNFTKQTYREFLQSIIDNASPEYTKHFSDVNLPVDEWLNYIYGKTANRYKKYFKSELTPFAEKWLKYVTNMSSEKYAKYFPENSGLTYKDDLTEALTRTVPMFDKQSYRQWLYYLVDNASLKYKKNILETNFPVEDWVDYISGETFQNFGIFFKLDLSDFVLKWLSNTLAISDDKYSSYFTAESGLTYEGCLIESLLNGEPIFEKQTYKMWLTVLTESGSDICKNYLIKVDFPSQEWINFMYAETVSEYGIYFLPELSRFSEKWVQDILSKTSQKYNKYFPQGSGFSYEAGIRDALSRSEPNFQEQTYKQWLESLIDAASPEYKQFTAEVKFPFEEWINDIINSTGNKYGPYFKTDNNTNGNSNNNDLKLLVEVWLEDVLTRTSQQFSEYFENGIGFSYEGWLRSSTANVILSIKEPLHIKYKKWLKLVVENTTQGYKLYLKNTKFSYNNWIDYVYKQTAGDYEGSSIAPGK